MDIQYFIPDFGHNSKPEKGLLNPQQVFENVANKTKKIEISKTLGLVSKNENRLLTNDGREIFNENK